MHFFVKTNFNPGIYYSWIYLNYALISNIYLTILWKYDNINYFIYVYEGFKLLIQKVLGTEFFSDVVFSFYALLCHTSVRWASENVLKIIL